MRHFQVGWIGLGMLLVAATAGACRYNVRDLGFMDIGDKPYVLYVYAPTAHPDLEAAFRDISEPVFRETNVRVQSVNASSESEATLMAALRAHPGLPLPAAVLQSPDGQFWPMTIEITQAGWEASLRSRLESLVVSAKRETILRAASEAFAVVLFLEGTEPEATRRARREINGAIEQIRTQMAWMPKAIARPPETVALDAAAQAGEAILLWSLGLDAQPAAEPRAAVVYGRARWIGPVARGSEITEDNLARLLAIIGADCECGLDISWTRGTPLPVRWSRARYEQAAKSLGFDPENPMVKIEASRILSRYGGSQIPSLGYQEIDLAAAGLSSDADTVSVDTAPGSAEPPSDARAPVAGVGSERRVDGAASAGEREPVLRRMLVVVSGLVAVLLCICFLILWRASKKNRYQ